jgi:hypothetical protein
MVVPDGIVEDELLVPLSPVVADLIVAIDYQSRDIEHLEAGVSREATLSST